LMRTGRAVRIYRRAKGVDGREEYEKTSRTSVARGTLTE